MILVLLMKSNRVDELIFKPRAIKDAEEYFKNVHMTQEQHGIFLDFVRIFLQHIPINEMAVKGIGWRAVSEWQLKHKRDLLGLENGAPEERVKSIDEILDIVKRLLTDILEDPNQKSILDDVMKDIMEFYRKEHAFR